MVLIFQKRLFILITIFFILTATGPLEIIDTEYSVRTAFAIIDNGTMLIDPVDPQIRERMPQIEGTDKIFSQYGIGILIIFIPIVLIGKLFASFTGIDQMMAK